MQDIKFKAILIRKPLFERNSRRSSDDNWQDTAYQWKVLVNDQSFDYYTGSGLVNKFGNPKTPTLDDVLYSLCSDAEALEQSFYEWCSNFGYDTDSMKAQQIYMACQLNALKLKKAGIDIQAERERLQDY